MQKIIKLNPQDDIDALRASIDVTDLSHVILVVPPGCAALDAKQGMQLLRRAAEDAGVEIALVSRDDGLRERAEEYGFPVFGTVALAQRARWQMASLERDLVQGAPKLAPEPMEPGRYSVRQIKSWAGFIVLGVLITCLMCAAATLFVPAANVRIVPSSVALTVQTEVSADPSISQVDDETRSIPARRVTQEISGTLQLKTTTQKSIPNAPSTGTVIFSNLRTETTLVPQGTIVKTSAGVPIRFTTTTTVTIPAGVNSRVEAPIQAMDPGPTGNVKDLAINAIEGSVSLEARVINTKATTAGSLRPVKVVTADDKKNLEAQLLQQLRQQGNALLQKSLKTNEFMPPESVLLDVEDETFDRAVDDPADVLGLKITATVFGLAIDRADTEDIVGTLLSKQLQAGYQMLPNGIQAQAQSGGKYQGIALRMPLKGVGYATPQIDVAKLSRSLQGKSRDEAAAYLSSAVHLARPADISITPIGWNRMPWVGFRLAVFVEPQTMGTK